MKTAIIGGYGFIGRWLVTREIDEPSVVIHRDNLQEISTFAPEIVINCAWEGVSGFDARNDEDLQKRNVNFNERLFELCKLSCKRWIGIGSQLEINKPDNPYAKYKTIVFNRISELCVQNNISFAWVRICSIYGPGDNKNNFLPFLINELLENKDVPLTDQNIPWDYLFIEDAAKAIAHLSQRQEEGIFELGSGIAYMTQDIAMLVRDKINPELKLLFGERPCRPFELKGLVADISRLRALGWQPKISLDKGLDYTIDSHKWNKKYRLFVL